MLLSPIGALSDRSIREKLIHPERPLGPHRVKALYHRSLGRRLHCTEPIRAPSSSRARLVENKVAMRILGIILISIGLLTLALPYVTFTKQEKVLDIGPVEAVAETRERIPISPVLGTIIFVAGAGIVIVSMTRKGAL